MKNKILFITGANGGLGSVLVKKIVELHPSKIYCSARDIKSLEALETLSPLVEAIEMDITSQDSINRAMAKVESLDILINNAGVNSNKPLFDESFIDIEVNLKGTMNLTQALFEKLKESKGTVVNITSVLALINLPILANYSLSKSALHSFTQALRAEFGLFGGEVYEVLPGPIETRMTEGSPMPKTKPEAIADAILASMAQKEYEIYPDGFAQMVKERLGNDSAKLTAEFAMSLQA